MNTEQMISSHPDVNGNTNRSLIEAIDAVSTCALTCTSCADACLAEQMVAHLRQCIRLNLDCADICTTTARLASRRTGSNEDLIRQVLGACVTACRVCAEECERHASQHEHCRICADSCRRCEVACQSALASM